MNNSILNSHITICIILTCYKSNIKLQKKQTIDSKANLLSIEDHLQIKQQVKSKHQIQSRLHHIKNTTPRCMSEGVTSHCTKAKPKATPSLCGIVDFCTSTHSHSGQVRK